MENKGVDSSEKPLEPHMSPTETGVEQIRILKMLKKPFPRHDAAR